MMLGEAIEKIVPSDRVVIINAAGQVIFRGYAANTGSAGIRKTLPGPLEEALYIRIELDNEFTEGREDGI